VKKKKKKFKRMLNNGMHFLLCQIEVNERGRRDAKRVEKNKNEQDEQ
jgi:hypothetical protein